jgi:hypothetical protein
MHSCCAYLPAFHAFSSEVNLFKQELSGAGNLDLASQVIVSILASLGARASPHSALLGVAGPDIENGKASLDLVKSAGQRRENAWRAIVNRATELASRPEILQVPTARNAQTLVAFVQMLMRAFSSFPSFLLSRKLSLYSRHSRRSETSNRSLLPPYRDGCLP